MNKAVGREGRGRYTYLSQFEPNVLLCELVKQCNVIRTMNNGTAFIGGRRVNERGERDVATQGTGSSRGSLWRSVSYVRTVY